ncbi:MAG: hypothetical protein A2X61_07195 [Ignavibacteria bacterium GWB2_35_12]|nr:MAG: hypothetical protein A2X63_14040 [Ignavibacteria bacterium GWA2_35_8]OGU39265.1 MAG: hypothetical protein A2X61_07195 [Ignavibacteria bacterium GWB2_35_12]OGU89461.1 MAG: hypothetical protein A2220_10940 [Ignavibacteria bacterium RIFOXYA2_FULL_35_10]OGV21147.1 MAG: hypothetical protein A2475_01295 [Ignavibacteria bacterium RIFOXYC2_FULL_35_21]
MKDLIIDMILNGEVITDSHPQIYTTGAYLVPLKVNVNKNEKYVGVVSRFNDDSYNDGEVCSPHIISDSVNNLI